jgi:hypothetical protein
VSSNRNFSVGDSTWPSQKTTLALAPANTNSILHLRCETIECSTRVATCVRHQSANG